MHGLVQGLGGFFGMSWASYHYVLPIKLTQPLKKCWFGDYFHFGMATKNQVPLLNFTGHRYLDVLILEFSRYTPQKKIKGFQM